MLELQHIHKMYNPGTINEICLFEDFNLKIEDGQFVSVVRSKFRQHGDFPPVLHGKIRRIHPRS